MPRIPALEHLRNRVVVNPLETAVEEDLNVSCCCRWKSMFTYLVPGADFLSCFAFTRCLTELFMDLFQLRQVQIRKRLDRLAEYSVFLETTPLGLFSSRKSAPGRKMLSIYEQLILLSSCCLEIIWSKVGQSSS